MGPRGFTYQIVDKNRRRNYGFGSITVNVVGLFFRLIVPLCCSIMAKTIGRIYQKLLRFCSKKINN